MEEAKPSMPTPTATNGRGGETLKEYSEDIEVRFTEFCKNGLSWDENMSMEAIKLFRDTKHLLLTNISAIGKTAEEAERFWFSFVSYAVKRLSKKKRDNLQQKSDHNGVMFFQILRLAKLNIVDFFKELPQFLVMAGPILSNTYGADWESRLEAKELLANFEHLGILSRFYKRACQELFLTTNGTVDKPAVSGDSSFVLEYQRFGWLLFLALRAHAFGWLKDLVTCTNGLVSILAILIIHVPAHFRNFRFGDSQWFVKKDDKGIDLLASLCNKYDTSEDELRKTLAKTNSLIADILKKKPCSASELKNENTLNINTDGLIYYEDWMEESSLQSSLDILEKDYDDSIHNNGGELDERVFINEEDSLLGSGGSKEKEQQLQPVAPPPKQATTSKKRKLPSEAENGGVGGSVGEKSEDFDISLAQLKDKILRVKKNQMDIDVERLAGSKKMVKFDGSSFCVDMEDYVMKKGFELLGDETRAEMEEEWKKLKADENKLYVRKLALLEEQLMDCCLSNHSSSSLEKEEEHKDGKTRQQTSFN